MTRQEIDKLVQATAPPRPRTVRPILVIGAGGIVRAAHLPAYRKAGFPVVGLMDQSAERAEALAREANVPHSFGDLSEALAFAPKDVVFDVAVPASELVPLLPLLPDRATVLMQKPMGETLDEAREIRAICRRKELTASVNFSLRYSPNNLAVEALATGGHLGELHDLQVQTTTYTPWQLWSFLAKAPRLEILYHSIHYFDLIRSWLGTPEGVFARTVRNPHTAELAPTKTVAILDYGPGKRVFVASNHHHTLGTRYQESFVQWEGLRGAARMRMGLNLDYPAGVPDTAEFASRSDDPPQWQSLPLSGNNFPDGFIGTMGALQAFAEGSAPTLPTHYEDAFETMALVEALYRANEQPGVPLPLE